MLRKHLRFVPLILLIVVLASFWFLPSAAFLLGSGLLLFSLMIAILFIINKHRKAYLEGKLTRTVFVRNISLEIFGVLLAMTIAGLAGRYLAQITIAQIANELAKLIASIVIGILAGAGIGLLVKRTWGKLVKP